jgi:hypothetical protein
VIEDEPTQDVRRPRPSRLPSPEIVGSGFAVVVTVMILAAAFAVSPPDVVSNPEPSLPPGISFQPDRPTPTPPVDPAAVDLIAELNDQLLGHREALRGELGRRTFRTSEVASIIRQISNTVDFAIKAVPELEGALGEDEIGGRLSATYQGISTTALDTLDASIRNAAAYRVGAGVLVEAIGDLPALQEELEALLEAPPSPSPSPSPSIAPSASPSPSTASTPPSVAPSPATASPRQTTAPGTQEPSPAPGEQIENGGFEQGVGEPWRLLIQGGADAVPAPDETAPGAGQLSARVDVAAPGIAYSSISLRQSGVALEPGRSYVVTLRVRSEGPREIRVRVASEQGFSYLSRRISTTTDWRLHSLEFFAPGSTSTAIFEILLGRSNLTTWIDSVSVRPR